MGGVLILPFIFEFMDKINVNYKEPSNSVAIMFRFLPYTTDNMVDKVYSSNLKLYEVINEITCGVLYDGDPLIYPIEKAINNYINANLNNANSDIIFWHDDYLQVLVNNRKVYIEFGEILGLGEADTINEIITKMYHKYNEDPIRIIIMIIDVIEPINSPIQYIYFDDEVI